MNRFIGLLQRNVLIAPLIAVVLLVIGLIIGLVVGWETVDFKPGNNDIVAAADAYATDADPNLAKAMVRGLSNDELTTMLNNLITQRAASNKPLEADRLRMLAQVLGVKVAGAPTPGVVGTPPPAGTRPPGTTPGAVTTTPSGQAAGGFDPIIAIIGIVVVILLAALAAVIFFVRVLPGMRKTTAARPARTERAATTPAETTAPVQEMRPGYTPAPTTTSGGLGRFVPTYVLGKDNFEAGFPLETAKGEFLGECGMGFSEKVGEGKPDKVTAFDLWLFEKSQIQTETLVLMSEFAFKDQTLRTKLRPKGEAVLAEKGKTLHLETPSLQIEALISELVYATNASFPPNSYFEKLVLEIVPTLKDGAH